MPSDDKDLEGAVCMNDLYAAIAKDTKTFLKSSIQKAEELLTLCGYQRSCDYSLLALGSLAREDFTPYSDFELAILFSENASEQDKQYFRILSFVLYFKVLCLGESTIPMSLFGCDFAEIKELKPGMQFDLGGKTPLGRDDEIYELINTPKGMAEYVSDESFKKHKLLAVEVSTVTEIYCSGTGNKLCEGYKKKLAECLEKEASGQVQRKLEKHVLSGDIDVIQREAQAIFLLGGDVQRYEPNLIEKEDESFYFNVKQELYRLVDRGLEGLAHYYGVEETSNWKRLEALCSKGRLTKEGEKRLKEALGLSRRSRLNVYLAAKGQKEIKPFTFNELSKLYGVVVSFYAELEVFCEVQVVSYRRNYQFKIEITELQSSKINGLVWKRLKDYEKAKKEFKQWLELAKKETSKSAQICANYFTGLMELECSPPNYEEAENHFLAVLKHCESTTNKRAILFEVHLGLCAVHFERKELQKIKENFEKAIKCWSSIETTDKRLKLKLESFLNRLKLSHDFESLAGKLLLKLAEVDKSTKAEKYVIEKEHPSDVIGQLTDIPHLHNTCKDKSTAIFEDKLKKKLPAGVEDFAKLIQGGYLFCDKTKMIKEFIDKGDEVTLITRWRREGKTLTMSMLYYFFAPMVYGRLTKGMFDNLKIVNEDNGQYISKYQGKYSVIFITLKDVKRKSLSEAMEKFNLLIREVYGEHAEILKSDKLREDEKQDFQKYLAGKVTTSDLEQSLKMLSNLLYKHYKQKVIILVDEYDAPVNAAYEKGYVDEMVEFMRNFFSAAFKTNPYLEKGVMTGILRISKENMLSSLNNLMLYTILDDGYKEYFGFTEVEVAELLQKKLDIPNPEQKSLEKDDPRLKEMKEWYNGYKIGGLVIYNPWSVISY